MKIAVLGGGTSPEATVSRSSAKQVIQGLSERHNTRYIELSPNMPAELIEYAPDVVFPVLHGSPGEDGSVQGFLEIHGFPFIGSAMTASALAIDKFQAKCVWQTLDLPVLPMKLLSKATWSDARCSDIEATIGNAVAIKPRAAGSAIGVRLLPNGGDLSAVLSDAFQSHDYLVVEPFKAGREITVAVLEHGGVAEALPIIEIQVLAANEWYDFTNRYKEGASRHVIEPSLPEATIARLKHVAIAAHQALGCRDFSRSDFIVDDQEFWLLELNTIPGMTPTSLFPDAARAASIEFPDLLELLVENASARHEDGPAAP